ncbi:toprim domain-containing protein, partial [Acidiphilium sp.]|uniref:toprim domain-containing protein n=1 Tax=Acidiphilium sp. TaxID=527 RepID=UPI003D057F06
DFRGVLRGGQKSLFRFAPGGTIGDYRRVAVTEAPIDALSLAALEQGRTDTIYVATTGGLGPGTVTALRHLVEALGSVNGTLAIATDADRPGDRHAARIEETIAPIVITVERLRPPGDAKDWNEVLMKAGI